MKFIINQLDLNNVVVVREALRAIDLNSLLTMNEASEKLLGLEAGIRAMVSVNESTELPMYVIMDALLEHFPTRFDPKAIPHTWLDLDQPFTMDFSKITPFHELYDQLPDEEKSDKDFRKKLLSVYLWELKRMQDEARRAQYPATMLWPFRQAGSQWIAEFEVKDLQKAVANSYNFHGQNTSQWIYAGCVLVQHGEVSTHH
jgi:hypothetical protein